MRDIRPTTRDAIVEAAFQILGETPTASLADIADRAGVGRATLHRQFSSREHLMATLAVTALEELGAAVDAATEDAPSYGEGLRLALHAIVPLANRQWFLSHEPVEHHADVAAAYAEDRAHLHEAIDEAKAEQVFDRDLPTAWIAESYDALIYAAWALVRDGEATPKQAADMAWRTLTKGAGKSEP